LVKQKLKVLDVIVDLLCVWTGFVIKTGSHSIH